MRSLKYLAAALPAINSAYAGAGWGGEDTVIVTATRYVTVCPVEFWTTCSAPSPSHPSTRSGGPSTTPSTTSSWGSTTTPWGGKNGTTITTTTNGYGTTITIPPNGFNGTTTTPTTTPTSSSNSTCFNAQQTMAPLNFFGNQCNQPSSRNSWCNGKSVSTDTLTQYTTGQTRTYNLVIEDAMINADGTGAIAGFTINGQTPGQPIIANWGDTVSITVTNNMKGNATTIHWHGILQHGTNDQDGVPGVTECGIAPGSSRTYTWVADVYGTGWYHSHLLSQYGGGIRGPIIIHGPATANYDYDLGSVMVDEKFTNSIFNLAKYYTTARGTLTPPNYLLNGKNTNLNATTGESARWYFQPGKKHMFRFINSAVQTAFVMHIDNHVMTVVSADFTPIVPYQTENLYIHSGQRYNVIVEANQAVASYYLRAIAQKGCGAAITNDGNGIANGIITYVGSCYDVPGPSNFTLDTTGVCIDEPLASLVPYVNKDAGSSAAFQQSLAVLPGGNVDSIAYGGPPINTWRFGGPQNFTGTASGKGTSSVNVTYDQPTLQLLESVGQPGSAIYSNAIVLNQTNAWVYWIIENGFITSHPMHLHGHDFAVLGQAEGQAFTSADIATLNFDNPIRRDTVLLFGSGAPQAPVPGYTVIGFQTNNPGAWLMHCHIIWHADGGMGLQFIERPAEISNYASSSQFQNECSAYETWQNADPAGRIKSPWESGIKIRHLEEHKFKGYSHGHEVRHE